jgi:signal transduction histidine kinase
VGVQTDVGGRDGADDALTRAGPGRLLGVFRQAPVAVAVLRGRVAADMVFELVNPRYAEMLPPGRSPLGRRLGDALPEVARTMGPVLQRVLDTGDPFIASDYCVPLDRDNDGAPEDYFFNFVYHRIVDEDGSVGGIIGIGTEVTESVRARHEAERARERAERLQALTAALARARTLEEVADVVVADMVVALGARTGALAARAPGEDALLLLRTVGFPAPVEAGVRRQPLDMRSPLVECYRTQAPLWIERRDGPDGLDARFPIIAPVWNVLGVASAAFVPLVAAGETVGVISFAFPQPRAFTAEEQSFLLALGRQAALAIERARLFDAEHVARQQAEEASRAKSEFLAVMSHELRTPLNAIGGYAELMEMGIRGPVTAQQRADLHRIQQSQRHLLGLINEVLNYAKLETGTVHFDVADVRVREALAGAEALVAPQAQAKGLDLVVRPCAPSLAVRADAEKLRQVLVNLLSNAIKFTDRGGRVELGCTPSATEVAIHVRDTGIGIAADQLGRIFEPFVQVRADLTRTAEGTGLGLAISRDLARGMGGDLTAVSTVGAGSTFTLTLPTAPPAA